MFAAHAPSRRACTGRFTSGLSTLATAMALFILFFTSEPDHRFWGREPDDSSASTVRYLSDPATLLNTPGVLTEMETMALPWAT